MKMRNATLDNLEDLYKIEEECFPPDESCKRKDFKKRLEVCPNHLAFRKRWTFKTK